MAVGKLERRLLDIDVPWVYRGRDSCKPFSHTLFSLPLCPPRPPSIHLGICPRDCSNHGLCYNGTCFCRPGFSGIDCSKKVDHVKPIENVAKYCAGRCTSHCLHICKKEKADKHCYTECNPTCNRFCVQKANARMAVKVPKGQEDQMVHQSKPLTDSKVTTAAPAASSASAPAISEAALISMASSSR